MNKGKVTITISAHEWHAMKAAFACFENDTANHGGTKEEWRHIAAWKRIVKKVTAALKAHA